ncbi:hypothetical protein AJ78_00041 [Emergomyces pasteurianus Ep9510]|uniref:Uncharacterized protein n=1 Tax=Emergomyces pasteurianus Ep9510 TaxID=1447872 RepID=A0A1J9PUE2_9EURO|nr:hypothetical protein AJ78_00041 [Emergomyces pasteurianus Ep9510]
MPSRRPQSDMVAFRKAPFQWRPFRMNKNTGNGGKDRLTTDKDKQLAEAEALKGVSYILSESGAGYDLTATLGFATLGRALHLGFWPHWASIEEEFLVFLTKTNCPNAPLD